MAGPCGKDVRDQTARMMLQGKLGGKHACVGWMLRRTIRKAWGCGDGGSKHRSDRMDENCQRCRGPKWTIEPSNDLVS